MASMSTIKHTSSVEVFSNKNYLDEPQNAEFKNNNHELYQRFLEI